MRLRFGSTGCIGALFLDPLFPRGLGAGREREREHLRVLLAGKLVLRKGKQEWNQDTLPLPKRILPQIARTNNNNSTVTTR